MTKILFVCSQNKLRSPTAEHVFSIRPGIETASAGTNRDAEVPLSAELVEWADIIFAMEKMHRARITTRFRLQLKGKKLVCLDIPDRFRYMDTALVALLERKVGPHLR